MSILDRLDRITRDLAAIMAFTDAKERSAEIHIDRETYGKLKYQLAQINLGIEAIPQASVSFDDHFKIRGIIVRPLDATDKHSR